jgi:hypothetical protein
VAQWSIADHARERDALFMSQVAKVQRVLRRLTQEVPAIFGNSDHLTVTLGSNHNSGQHEPTGTTLLVREKDEAFIMGPHKAGALISTSFTPGQPLWTTKPSVFTANFVAGKNDGWSFETRKVKQ